MALVLAGPAGAAEKLTSAQLDALFVQLADPDNSDWQATQQKILDDWSRSGSPALDFLLQRGRDAMAAGDLDAAIADLTALTDQAPDFAEGWNARATAYYLHGLFGPSIADIEHVLTLEPRHFGAISGLGLILEQTDRKPDALRAFHQSLSINPHQDGIRKEMEDLEKQMGGTDL